MALQHYATCLCDYPIRAADGRVSLVGVFYRINAGRLPALKEHLGIYICFGGRPGERYTVDIEGAGVHHQLADGVIAEAGDGDAVAERTCSTLVEVQTAIFPQEGCYYVVLRQGEEEVHRCPLQVRLRPTEEVCDDATSAVPE